MVVSDSFLENFSIASLVSVVFIGGLSFYSFLGQPSVRRKVSRNHLTVGGLINDGNTCFMNSVIQAFCSMKKFQDYINLQELKGPVTTALQKLIDVLAISNEQIVIRPSDLVQKMSQTKGGIRHLLGYQQQDAQEFFQYLSSLVTNEQTTSYRSKLLLIDSSFLAENDHYALFGTRKISWRPPKRFHSPLTGLLASGILCKICKHQTTLQHNTFDNLALPIYSNYIPSIYSMIKSYTAPELIEDYICENCSLIATINNSEYTLKRFCENINTNFSGPVSKKTKEKAKKRRKNKTSKEEYQLRKSIDILKQALNTQDFDITMPEGITKVKVSSPCEKQTILASPPVCLCLHMQRSMMLPTGRVVKNNSPVNYEEILDINDLILGTEKESIISKIGAAFKTQGILQRVAEAQDMKGSLPVFSDTAADSSKSQTAENVAIPKDVFSDTENFTKNETSLKVEETAAIQQSAPSGPFIYRLSAVILHYGNHDSGHFVTLRRDAARDLWFRVSDDSVEKILNVEQEVFVHGSRYAYMIFYERIN